MRTERNRRLSALEKRSRTRVPKIVRLIVDPTESGPRASEAIHRDGPTFQRHEGESESAFIARAGLATPAERNSK